MEVTIKFTGTEGEIAKEFAKRLENDIQSCMSKLGESAQRILELTIKRNLYGSLPGSDVMTGSISKAHTLNINGMSFELYMDSSKMEYRPWDTLEGNKYLYGANMSKDGSKYGDELIEKLNIGGVNSSEYRDWQLPETGYFELARELIEDDAVKKLASCLRAKGYRVSIG